MSRDYSRSRSEYKRYESRRKSYNSRHNSRGRRTSSHDTINKTVSTICSNANQRQLLVARVEASQLAETIRVIYKFFNPC
jgi:hypothetical protein